MNATIGRFFLNGVSTRKLKGLVRELMGKEVSAQTLSATQASPDQELEQYRNKLLTDTVEFLFLLWSETYQPTEKTPYVDHIQDLPNPSLRNFLIQ